MFLLGLFIFKARALYFLRIEDFITFRGSLALLPFVFIEDKSLEVEDTKRDKEVDLALIGIEGFRGFTISISYIFYLNSLIRLLSLGSFFLKCLEYTFYTIGRLANRSFSTLILLSLKA